MRGRQLAVLFGLTLGDYLLWNWLSGGRDVLALVSGLTLPPLVVACAAMLAVNVARVIARSTTRMRDPTRTHRATAMAPARDERTHGSMPAPGLVREDAATSAITRVAPSPDPASETLAA